MLESICSVTFRSQDNFLYFEKKRFGINEVWKDVSDFSLVGQRWPRVEHTCLRSQMQISVPCESYDAVWNSMFVGPLNLGQGTKYDQEMDHVRSYEGNRMIRGYLN